MSLVEVCATCLKCVTCGSLVIEVQYLKTFFMNFNKNFLNEVERIFLVFKTDFLYHQNAHFIL